ncbi:UPF0029-domain-containing protein [Aureobasidium subglaciale]|nr:UPF0029-domain-containing protein [Aureobasidium subglaciale]KAI5223186.1 UPF0029-domain-containing protein [Aureobasidium subglaciale]KAI5259804.1 UPF0029-domain-containing protein [Aureobasidium subglaciale]
MALKGQVKANIYNPMESALEDECQAINAIYSESTLAVLSQDPTICSLELPGEVGISLRLEFPQDYPDAPPSILGTQSVGENIAKGQGTHAVDLARSVLAEVYQPGSPCIFDLVEEVSQRLQQYNEDASQNQGNQEQQDAQRRGQQLEDDDNDPDPDEMQSLDLLDKEPPWILSDVFTEKKSVFVARAAAVTSPGEAKSYLAYLLATDKKVAKASHNITAWRIHGPNDTAFQDCDDDGETAAGGRLLHLMQLMDIWDVMVVVTRWYGGVHLGPDRFRLINTTARDAFVKGGYVQETGKAESSNKKKGKK